MPATHPRRARRWRRSTLHPIPWWVGALALALVLGVTTERLLTDLDTARMRWGARTQVLVAAADLTAGHVIHPDDLARVTLPQALLPDTPAVDAIGRVVTSLVLAGEPLPEERLAPAGVGGVAALVPPGRRALVVSGVDLPRLEMGDRVDVIITYGGDAGTTTAGILAAGSTAARAAPVVDVAEESVTVAVRRAEVERAATAVANGAVVLALAGPAG